MQETDVFRLACLVASSFATSETKRVAQNIEIVVPFAYASLFSQSK